MRKRRRNYGAEGREKGGGGGGSGVNDRRPKGGGRRKGKYVHVKGPTQTALQSREVV